MGEFFKTCARCGDRCGVDVDKKKYTVYLKIENEQYSKSIRQDVCLCDRCAKEALEPIINGVENLSGGA